MANKIEENRQQIQAKLEEILGSSNVYFQPPETKRWSIRVSVMNGLTELMLMPIIELTDSLHNMR